MRVRAFWRDAVFVMGVCNIAAGALFFFLFGQILDLVGIEADIEALTPTVRVAAVLLFVYGVGYLFASRNVVRNHLMLFVGLLQNAGVAGIAAWYWVNEPELMPNACLLPAGLSALFAVVFLFAWFGALIESRLEHRRARRVKVAPPRPVAGRLAGEPVPAVRKPEAAEVEAPEKLLPLEQPAPGELPESLPEAPAEAQSPELELPSGTEPEKPGEEPPGGPA